MRAGTAGGWRSTIVAVVATAAVAVTACGQGPGQDDARTSSEPWVVPVDRAVLVAGFHTYFAGNVVFGGSRCTPAEGEDGCPEIVHELTAIDGDGRSRTVEVARDEHGGEVRSTGLHLYGVVGDRLLVSDSATVVEVGTDLEVRESGLAIGSGEPNACVIGGDLYGIEDTALAPAGSPPTPAPGATVTTLDPDPASVRHSWVVSRWDGRGWAPVPGGGHSATGAYTLQCLSAGFVVVPVSPGPLGPVWTPSGGWHQPPPDVASLDLFGARWGDPENDYVIREGRLHRVDLDDGLAPTPMTSARLATESAEADPPDIEMFDASGTVILACGQHPDGLRCALVPKA